MVKKKKKVLKNTKTSEKGDTVAVIEKMIKEQIEEKGEKLTEEEKAMTIEGLKQTFIEGKTPGEAMKIPEGLINLLYKRGYDLYNLGQYKQANEIFRMLCFLEPHAPRFHLGLAATNHKMGNYETAIPVYFVSWYLDTRTPIPLYYISDCFLKMKEPACSYTALRMTVNVCGESNEYSQLKNRCYMMMKQLREEHGFGKEDEEEEEGEGKKTEKVEGEIDIFEQLQQKAEDDIGGSF